MSSVIYATIFNVYVAIVETTDLLYSLMRATIARSLLKILLWVIKIIFVYFELNF